MHLILLTLITTLQLAHDWITVISLLYVFVPWWMAHWEEYHTGVMSYGSGLWGVTEANYAVFIIHMLTYLLVLLSGRQNHWINLCQFAQLVVKWNISADSWLPYS